MIIEVDAVLFDNDGVLVDSHELVDRAWRRLASEFALDADALQSELAGVRAVDTLARHVGPAELSRAVDRLEDLEVAMAGDTPLMAGAASLLTALPLGSWAIATSASRRLAEARWRGAGIATPAVTITADDVSKGKPDPEPYVAAAAQLGIDPTRCLVFEDSASGAIAGRTAGAVVAAVGAEPWPFEPIVRVPDLTGVSVALTPGDNLALRFSSQDASP